MNNDKSAPAAPARASHIKLEMEWGAHPAGKILAADDDLLSALDVAGVKYRAATDFERRVGGFYG